MNAPLRIMRIRRTYNQWVANQTMEDYALRFTAKSARQWSMGRVANTALGAVSFLALEAIGGSLTLSYGFINTFAAVAVVSVLIFITAVPITLYAARYGVDIDLLTRGAGFGYIGSTITSLIYASFTFIFFAIEAAIMSLALEMCFGIPLAVGYILSSIIVIPVVTHGITLISRFQLWTQPIWLTLQLVPVVVLALGNPRNLSDWTTYKGANGDGSFDILLFGAAATVAFSLVAQIGEQVDFLRFMPPPTPQSKRRWTMALLAAGPGWIIGGALKILIGSFLTFMAIQMMVPANRAAEPTQMYLNAFQEVVSSPKAALLLTALFVIVAQIKINVTNAYAGSIAWSNFFSRLTHSHSGRVVWVVFNVMIAIILMELDVYRSLERILGVYSLLAVAWVGALVADLTINKPLGLSPPGIEFKRAHLYDINPVGTGAMLIAATLAVMAYAGIFGTVAKALAPFIALLSAMTFAPLIAWVTGGRYYVARSSTLHENAATSNTCIVCEYVFEEEDMAHCPVYAGPICSLCCSLDARCHDRCKPGARLSDQTAKTVGGFLPKNVTTYLQSQLGRYVGIMLLFNLVIVLILGLIYTQVTLDPAVPAATISSTLLKVFAILLIIVGVAVWLLVLAQESRKVALEESDRQTNLLLNEIEAHRVTDRKLQKAKEAAEAANSAKSRYLGSISHELRTPLNVILGYAQLLGRDTGLPPHAVKSVRVVQRSSEHLSSLIDGLLDIARIEAGKFQLEKDTVCLPEFIDQIVDMFRLQAAGKRLRFIYDPRSVPAWVHTDSKQLRQILINLLSNAIKFTPSGHVALRVRGRGETVEFEVEDTGVGISGLDLERIFQPFERASANRASSGVGLGLTITKLMVKVMGGDLSVESVVDGGATFRVRLHLPRVPGPVRSGTDTSALAYSGTRRKILIIDDEQTHRELLRQTLESLGFQIFEADNALQGIETARRTEPNLVLLDVAMPGIDGWEAAQMLQKWRPDLPIIMVSANTLDMSDANLGVYREYILKPVDLDRLIASIGRHLDLAWVREADTQKEDPAITGALPAAVCDELNKLARIGYVRGLNERLAALSVEFPLQQPQLRRLQDYAAAFDFGAILAALERRQHG